MLVLNIGFTNSLGKKDETQLDIEEYNNREAELIEFLNLVLSLKEEMDIVSVDYIIVASMGEELV